MSELITPRARADMRLRLLSTVSALSLLTIAASRAQAEDTNRPIVWIELGGQLERVDGGQERFAPSFLSQFEPGEFTSPLEVERPPRYATGFEGKLSFQPEASNWVFSAAIRYGRSNDSGKLHEEGPHETAERIISIPRFGLYRAYNDPADARRYSDTAVKNNENHAVVDFMAGKDVGLGLFGRDSTSIFSAGVRFAQFESQSAATIGGDPDFVISYEYATQVNGFPGYLKLPQQSWHLNRSKAEIRRSFHGLGPSVAWDASAPVVGSPDRAELTFDWGINAAVLFGRQKVKAHHETNSYHHYPTSGIVIGTTTAPPNVRNPARSRSVTVPNIGGFAGLSLKFPNAKVSLGYRADFFFGAIDGGIDARKTYDRAFYGPFATVSIGLGG
jgi:hypothetical protein